MLLWFWGGKTSCKNGHLQITFFDKKMKILHIYCPLIWEVPFSMYLDMIINFPEKPTQLNREKDGAWRAFSVLPRFFTESCITYGSFSFHPTAATEIHPTPIQPFSAYAAAGDHSMSKQLSLHGIWLTV